MAQSPIAVNFNGRSADENADSRAVSMAKSSDNFVLVSRASDLAVADNERPALGNKAGANLPQPLVC